MSDPQARPLGDLDTHMLEWYAKRPWHRSVLAEAEDSIRESLALSDRAYIAFSCGKDSTALALLVHEQNPAVPLRFLSSSETRDMHDVDGVMDWFRNRGAVVDEWRVDEIGTSWDDHQQVTRESRYRALYEDGRDLVFLGLRASESPARSVSLHAHRTAGLPIHCYRYRAGSREGMLRCCPLARWRDQDIAAVIARHGAPLLAEYHRSGMGSRTTARLTARTVGAGALISLRHTNPVGYRAVLRRFPELQEAIK